MLLKSLFIVTLHCTSGLGMRLPVPEIIYITTQSPLDDHGEINRDLVAPAPSSLSQYYQEQPEQQHFYQPTHHNLNASPFLYNGQLVLVEMLPQLRESKNIEENSPNHAERSYSLYRPSPQDNPQFADMLPPSEKQNEPNYYAIKLKKNKKYSEVEHADKKSLKKKENSSLKNVVDQSLNKQQVYPEEEEEIASKLPDSSENVRKEREASDKEEEDHEEDDDSVEISAPSSRLDFQMHAHKGPSSYKFGFDTGKGKNRQFKIEEKDEKGDVFGQYGYHDDKGKFRIVKYSSKANDGFRILSE